MKFQWIGAALGLALGGAALAQDSGPSGPSLRIGGGVEGYTGALNDLTSVGPTWGVALNLRPARVLGVELAYSGAATEASSPALGEDGLTGGPDILRNGAQAALIVGTPTRIQPYVMGGIGFDYYSVRDDDLGASQFDDDASGAVPLGAGVRTNGDGISADLRFTYNALFSEQFAGNVDRDFGDGRYAATLQLGGNF